MPEFINNNHKRRGTAWKRKGSRRQESNTSDQWDAFGATSEPQEGTSTAEPKNVSSGSRKAPVNRGRRRPRKDVAMFDEFIFDNGLVDLGDQTESASIPNTTKQVSIDSDRSSTAAAISTEGRGEKSSGNLASRGKEENVSASISSAASHNSSLDCDDTATSLLLYAPQGSAGTSLSRPNKSESDLKLAASKSSVSPKVSPERIARKLSGRSLSGVKENRSKAEPILSTLGAKRVNEHAREESGGSSNLITPVQTDSPLKVEEGGVASGVDLVIEKALEKKRSGCVPIRSDARHGFKSVNVAKRDSDSKSTLISALRVPTIKERIDSLTKARNGALAKKKGRQRPNPRQSPLVGPENFDAGSKKAFENPKVMEDLVCKLLPITKANPPKEKESFVSFTESSALPTFLQEQITKPQKVAAAVKAVPLVKGSTCVATSNTSSDKDRVAFPAGGMKSLLHRLNAKSRGKRKRTEVSNESCKTDGKPHRSNTRQRTDTSDVSEQPSLLVKGKPAVYMTAKQQAERMMSGAAGSSKLPLSDTLSSKSIQQIEATLLRYGYVDQHGVSNHGSALSIPTIPIEDDHKSSVAKSGCLGSGKKWRSIGPKALEISWPATASKNEIFWEVAIVQYINKRQTKPILPEPAMLCQYKDHVAVRVELREKVTVLGTVEDVFQLHYVFGLGMIPETVVGWLVVETMKLVGSLHKLGIAHNSLGLSSLLVVHSEESDEWMLYMTGLESNANIRESGDLRSHFAHDMFSIAATTWSLLTGGNPFVFNKINGKVEIDNFNMVTNNHWLRGKDGWKDLFLDLVNPSLDTHGIHMFPTTTVRMMEGIVSMGRFNAGRETPVAVASFFEGLLKSQSECPDLVNQCFKISVDLAISPDELVLKLLCDELPRRTIFLGSPGRRPRTQEKIRPSPSKVLDVIMLECGATDNLIGGDSRSKKNAPIIPALSTNESKAIKSLKLKEKTGDTSHQPNNKSKPIVSGGDKQNQAMIGSSPSKVLEVEVEVFKSGATDNKYGKETLLDPPSKRHVSIPAQATNESTAIRRIRFEDLPEDMTRQLNEKSKPVSVSGRHKKDVSQSKGSPGMLAGKIVRASSKPKSNKVESEGTCLSKDLSPPLERSTEKARAKSSPTVPEAASKRSNLSSRKRSRGSPVRVSVLESLNAPEECLAEKSDQRKSKKRKSSIEQDQRKHIFRKAVVAGEAGRRRSTRAKLTCGVDGCNHSFESGLMWVLMYNLEDKLKGMDPHISSVPIHHAKHLICQGCRPMNTGPIFMPSEVWKRNERSQIKKFEKYLYYLCSKGDYENNCDSNPDGNESTTI